MSKLLQMAVVLMLSATLAHAKVVMVDGVKMDATIIDVRTAGEFAAGHLDGAINIPVDQLEVRIHTVDGLKKDSQILIYCHSGRRSAMAKETLQKLGFQKIHDGGGMVTLVKTLKNCSAQSC